MCELYEKKGCLGCESLNPEYDIDTNKWLCEDYIKWNKKTDKGEQISL